MNRDGYFGVAPLAKIAAPPIGASCNTPKFWPDFDPGQNVGLIFYGVVSCLFSLV